MTCLFYASASSKTAFDAESWILESILYANYSAISEVGYGKLCVECFNRLINVVCSVDSIL